MRIVPDLGQEKATSLSNTMEYKNKISLGSSALLAGNMVTLINNAIL